MSGHGRLGALAILLALALLAPVTAPAAPAGPAPRTGGTLVYGIRQEPSTTDPHGSAAAVAQRVLASMYDSLVFMTPRGQMLPWLAESWDVSPGARTYTFKLRRDVKFHDGTRFDAAAVKFNLDRIIDPATRSTSAISALGPYDRTEVVDEFTARVHFKESYAPFLYAASTAFLGIVSPAAARRWGADFNKHPTGSGPFRFESMVPGDNITMVRNPDYRWPPKGFFRNTGTAYLDKIVIRTIPEASTRLSTLENGETNAIEPVPEKDVARLTQDRRFRVLRALYPGAPRMVFLNTKRPPTDELAVRRAVLHGFSQDLLVRTLLFSVHTPAKTPLTPGTVGYDKSLEGMYPYDPEKAKSVLEEAGWRMGPDGIRTKGGRRLVLDQFIIANIGMEPPAEFLQGQLREVGIQVDLKVMARAAWYEGINKGDHHLVPLFYIYADLDLLRGLYHSKRIPFNWSHVGNAELDRDLEEGYRSPDINKRIETYRRVQRKIMELALVLPLYNEFNLVGIRTEVRGMLFDPTAYPLFYDVWLERR
jgi:peptide/nickel transport system substrate-binding protein